MDQLARHGGRAGIYGVVVDRPPAPAGCPMYVRISEFSPLLDDHGMFQSIRVMKVIRLRVFDLRKGPVRWEGLVRGGDDICYRCRLSMCALLHKSPFSMYFTPSKVSRLSMVNSLLIVTSATLSRASDICYSEREESEFGRRLG